MTFSMGILVLFCVSLVLSGLGWRRFTYFISVGYGLAVAGCAVAIIAMRSDCLQPSSFALCLLLILYGLRLSGFLVFREIRSVSYKRLLPQLTKTKHPLHISLAVWLGVSVLYTMLAAPVFYRLDNEALILPVDSTWALVGSLIMAAGLALESWADVQKYLTKNGNPERFCDTGLFRIVRCPNYLGEVVFWTGCFLSGIGSNRTVGQWLVCILGYLCILYIIFSAVRKLELRQNESYSEDPEYQDYVAGTPVLIPLVPLHRLEPYSFLRW